MEFGDDGEEESVQAVRRRNFWQDFTRFHALLLDTSFGIVKPNQDSFDPSILANDTVTTTEGLMQLALMVQIEFLESLQREAKGSEDAAASQKSSEPHPYDVWLMETTIDKWNRHMAVCMPNRANELCWYDGFSDLWPLDPPCHKWRVASLSGPARTLAALHNDDYKSTLMESAMKRDGIMDVLDDDAYADGLLQSHLSASTLAKLNSSQRQAVATFISPNFQRGFLTIQGPPGTGKSTLLVAMIVAFQREGGLLVTAPSNAAVASLALKAWNTGLFRLEDLLVFGENSDSSVYFLNPIFRGEFHSRCFKDFAKLSDLAKEKVLQQVTEWLHSESELSLADLAQLCPFIDRTTWEGRNFYGNLISRAKVVFCTLNSSGSAFLRRNTSKVQTILLDEAGQCTEAEFYIGASFPGVERMVVVGDPKQLPATVIHNVCRRSGLGRSWLEKVHRIYHKKVHVLDTQYRMHPQILTFSNENFYDGQINSGDNVHRRTPFVEFPFRFVNTNGKGHEEFDDFSFRNHYEVTVVKNLLVDDPDIVRLMESDNRCRIIIITPYKSQVALLREHISKLKLGSNCEVSTVDAFQGQEGDVVIISFVRTHKVGFIDDAQRVNVAITRAKRVLRIVGDATFFEGLRSSSTLHRLVQFAKKRKLLIASTIQSHPWCPPNWNSFCLWKPIMSSRFQNIIQRLTQKDKNICMNALLALCQANIEALDGGTILQTRRGRPIWYTSYLRSHGDKRLVWYAKMLRTQAIEAVFAGSRRDCHNFIGKTPLPPDALAVQSDLKGPMASEDDHGSVAEEIEDAELVSSWRVTNATQARLIDGNTLPRSNVQLDQCQDEVCSRQPPLIIESRSGTGKTLVLIQHAAYHYDDKCASPACFVTVSPGLREELKKRYEEINEAENLQLPETHFYTFDELLERLLRLKKIREFENHRRCTFLGFKSSQKSFERDKVEPELIENEIGGVILGSLTAACQGKPLSREQYMIDLRSNVGRQSEVDLKLRNRVYDEYEVYLAWKRETGKYDLGDMVMRLLKENWDEFFSSLYLDEVQDFSYAGAYLLFHLGGKSRLRWICAGDPAQMISPGCSFTFDGLKQVMLSVRNGIESHLSGVSHLFVNYRTTKDVLLVANEVLHRIRTYFPGAISFARPETARKDLKLKIVLCDRSLALKQQVKLNANQAIVFSSKSRKETERELSDWIGAHPFILSSSESKGLEFDDVIVLFDHERKTWLLDRRSDATLRMLRELYVAITRAQRQLVILVDKSIPSMVDFFGSIDYDFYREGAEMVLREFDTISSSDEWIQKAEKFVSNMQFHLAARCFILAGDKAMSSWCSGKAFEADGDDIKAVQNFLSALDAFAAKDYCEKVLEVCQILSSPGMASLCDWTPERSLYVERAILLRPDHLPRSDLVKLAIARGLWNDIRVEDILNPELASLLLVYRENLALRKLVKNANNQDREEVLYVAPALIGDYHKDKNNLVEAISAYLRCHSAHDALSATADVLRGFESGQQKSDDVLRTVSLWIGSGKSASYPVSLLLELFRAPVKVGKLKFKECMTQLGRPAIILAVDEVKSGRTTLHDINPSEFFPEVAEELLFKFHDHVKVVQWYCQRDCKELALDFGKQHAKKLSARMICDVVLLYRDVPKWLVLEADRRNEVAEMLLHLFASSCSSDMRQTFLTSITDISEELKQVRSCGDIVLLAWCFGKLSEGSAKKKKSKRQNTPKLPDANKISFQFLQDRVQYCAVALVSYWPDDGDRSRGSLLGDDAFSSAECVSLLSFLFESAGPSLHKHVASKMLKLGRPERFLAPLLKFVIRHGPELSVATTITKKAVAGQLSFSRLREIGDVWSSYLESCQYNDFPPDLFPPLTDMLISSNNYDMACRIVAHVLSSSSLLTKAQLEAVKSSSALSSSMVSFALISNYTEVGIQATKHCFQRFTNILPTLHAWNNLTTKGSKFCLAQGEGEISKPLLFHKGSLLSLLMIVNQDSRCLFSKEECFHRLLLEFGPKPVAFAYMYRGVQDLDSDLFEKLSRYHDEIRKELPVRSKIYGQKGQAQNHVKTPDVEKHMAKKNDSISKKAPSTLPTPSVECMPTTVENADAEPVLLGAHDGSQPPSSGPARTFQASVASQAQRSNPTYHQSAGSSNKAKKKRKKKKKK